MNKSWGVDIDPGPHFTAVVVSIGQVLLEVLTSSHSPLQDISALGIVELRGYTIEAASEMKKKK